jgi:phage shock protein PspC (stress-responsive transcriptional regulator)
MGNRLYRSRDDRMIAGVAGGVAEYFDLDPSLVRIAWAVLAFVGGFGVLLYIVMAIVVPEDDLGADPWVAPPGAGTASPGTPPAAPGSAPGAASATPSGTPAASLGLAPDRRAERFAERDARRAARRARRDDGGRTASLVIGGLLLLAGIAFLLRELIPQISFDLFWPFVLVILGVVVLASAFRGDGNSGSSAPPPPSVPGSGPDQPS